MDLRKRGSSSLTGEAFYGSRNRNKQLDKKKTENTKEHTSKEKRFQGESHFCHKTGHKKADCFKWKKQRENSNQGNIASSLERHEGFAVFKEGKRSTIMDNDDAWVSDSGDYAHITRNRHWFFSLTPIKEEKIFIGDGSCVTPKLMGTITVAAFDGNSWFPTTLKEVRYVSSFGKVNLNCCSHQERTRGHIQRKRSDHQTRKPHKTSWANERDKLYTGTQRPNPCPEKRKSSSSNRVNHHSRCKHSWNFHFSNDL